MLHPVRRIVILHREQRVDVSGVKRHHAAVTDRRLRDVQVLAVNRRRHQPLAVV